MKDDHFGGYFFKSELKADLMETVICYQNARIKNFIITTDRGKSFNIGIPIIEAIVPKHGGKMILHVEGDIELNAMMKLFSEISDIYNCCEEFELEFNLTDDGSGIAKLLVCEVWNAFEESLEMKEGCSNEQYSYET